MSVRQEGVAVLRGAGDVNVLLGGRSGHQILLLIVLYCLAQALDAPLVTHLLAAQNSMTDNTETVTR